MDALATPPARRIIDEPALPPERRLDMPTQSFRRWSRSQQRPLLRPDLWFTPWMSRLFVFGGALAITAYGVYEMYQVVSVSRTTSLQYLLSRSSR